LRVRSPNNLRNKNIFYTDSNGLEMHDRFYSYKPEYDMNYLGNPITDNYYPVNSAIYIEDPSTKVRFTLMTERALAGSSQNKGEIEVVIHSRNIDTFSDDIDDTENDGSGEKSIAARTTTYLLFSNDIIKSKQRDNQVDIDNKPVTFYAAVESNFFTKDEHEKQSRPSVIPEHVKVSIKNLDENDIQIRFTNLHDTETAEFDFYSGTTKVVNYVLSELFRGKDIITNDIYEVSLTGNQLRSEVLKNKLVFRELHDLKLNDVLPKNNNKLTLRPLEIRTFVARNIAIENARLLIESKVIIEPTISSEYISIALFALACVIAFGVSAVLSRKIQMSRIETTSPKLPISAN